MRFTEKRLIQLCGVTRHRVRYWRKIGLLPPCEGAGKQGYSFTDILRIRVVSALVAAKITPSRIKKTLDSMRLMLHKDNVLTGKALYVCGREIFIFQGGKAIVPRTGQFLLFDVDEHRKKLEIILYEKNLNNNLSINSQVKKINTESNFKKVSTR